MIKKITLLLVLTISSAYATTYQWKIMWSYEGKAQAVGVYDTEKDCKKELANLEKRWSNFVLECKPLAYPISSLFDSRG